MKKYMKKYISLLLALLLALSLCVPALAASAEPPATPVQDMAAETEGSVLQRAQSHFGRAVFLLGNERPLAQAANILYKLLGVTEKGSQPCSFTDVKSSNWAYAQILAASTDLDRD